MEEGFPSSLRYTSPHLHWSCQVHVLSSSNTYIGTSASRCYLLGDGVSIHSSCIKGRMLVNIPAVEGYNSLCLDICRPKDDTLII